MWLAIFGAVLLFAIAGAAYIVCGFHRFSLIKKLGEKHRFLAWAVSAVIAASVCGAWAIVNVWSAAVVMIHLFIIWLLCDIIAAIVHRIRGKKPERYIAGAAALIITAAYLGAGWYFAHHIYITEYKLTTDKNVGDGLRIALIADSHLGITLDGEEFAEQMERISALEPDIVAVAGDFVDDESKKADMERACQALGGINSTYGVYFVYGNHDKGYYSEDYRDFSSDDLDSCLKENGVVVLSDESITVGDNIYVIGRRDKYEESTGSGRAAMDELISGLDSSRYTIVLDHQPNDYAAEAEAGADLVLSGHTHGGPLIPAGQIGLLMGANDRVYGHERRSSTDFIVTSGISGWAIPFKTGTVSEIVVVDIVDE